MRELMGLFSRSRPLSDDPRLMEAAKRADVEAIRVLLDGRVNPGVRDPHRYTPLMRAVSKVSEHPDRGIAIDLLLAAGAEVNAEPATPSPPRVRDAVMFGRPPQMPSLSENRAATSGGQSVARLLSRST
jgi:ankyrin repeat protein